MSCIAASASAFTGRAVRVSAKAHRGRARAVSARVDAKLQAGDKVKVTSKVVVFHMPKGDREKGTDLNGWEGEVVSRADDYNGTYISANLEVRVAFPVKDDPKGKTFVCHMKESELEAV